MRYAALFVPALVLVLAASLARAEDPVSTAPPAKNPVVLMKVQKLGTIEIELYRAAAPKTVQNFIDLAEGRKEWTHPVTKVKSKKPFFDGLTFHRVIPNFMLQGGDPAGNGTGGPGYAFEDEINAKSLGLDKMKLFADPQKGQPHPYIGAILDPRNPRLAFQQMVIEPLLKKLNIQPVEANKRLKEWQPKMLAMSLMDVYENQGFKYSDTLKSYGMKNGYIAMANSGPNTNGSQFFINLKDNDYLTGKHTVFGKVVGGLDVVKKIAAVRTNGQQGGNKPIQPVVIDFVRLKR